MDLNVLQTEQGHLRTIERDGGCGVGGVVGGGRVKNGGKDRDNNNNVQF